MRRSNAPTLQDVAREAGVTAMAASVVLNGATSSTRVSEAARARIVDAAAKLRYRRNAVARGLSRRRLDTLGVVAVIGGGEMNLYFLELLNGILEAASEQNQNTTVFSITGWSGNESRILGFCDGRVDGMILIAPILTAAFAETLPGCTPVVTSHSHGALPPGYNLDVDNEGGAYAMVRWLIDRGHRRIAHFPGALDLSGARLRLAGYRRALDEAGIPADDSLILPGHFNSESGKQRMTALLERPDPGAHSLPTAVFCASDTIACGCIEALGERGLRVPDDISIAGFDDTLTARMTIPPLTTVRQPFRRMGRRAVELLLAQICGEPGAEPGGDAPRTEIFEAELVVRGSVGPPPR